MKYARIIMACAGELWAIERQKLSTIVEVLAFQAAGGKLDAGELEARGVTQKREGEVVKASGSVAVMPIYGVLAQRMNMLDAVSNGGGTSIEQAQQVFRALLADDQVKAIVMNFDSPGGTVAGTEEFAQEIYDARGIKPIIAQIDSLAASAAYWLAAQADEIVVTPGGHGGSIGVYSVHEEISAALEKAGIKRTIIASSDAKVGASQLEPLSDEARADIQGKVDYAATMFDRAVARGRNVTQSIVKEKFGNGKVYNAEQMVRRGMADRVAPLKSTLERFGVNVSPARRAGANAARSAMASGNIPSKPDLEDLLREQGAPRSLATLIAGRGHAESRSESGEAVRPTRETVAKMTESLRGFTLPSFKG